MIEHKGVEYVTAAEAAQLLGGDVNAALIRDWVRRGLLKPAGRHPGRANVYAWPDVLAAEQATHQTRHGRRRMPPDPAEACVYSQLTGLTEAARNPERLGSDAS